MKQGAVRIFWEVLVIGSQSACGGGEGPRSNSSMVWSLIKRRREQQVPGEKMGFEQNALVGAKKRPAGQSEGGAEGSWGI